MINSPRELLEALTGIFPKYAFNPDEASSPTYHGLMIDFACYYGSVSCTDRQLKDFAALINAAVDAGGDLENAFSTCLLEHLGNRKWTPARKPLMPFLSKAVKERLHA